MLSPVLSSDNNNSIKSEMTAKAVKVEETTSKAPAEHREAWDQTLQQFHVSSTHPFKLIKSDLKNNSLIYNTLGRPRLAIPSKL